MTKSIEKPNTLPYYLDSTDYRKLIKYFHYFSKRKECHRHYSKLYERKLFEYTQNTQNIHQYKKY